MRNTPRGRDAPMTETEAVHQTLSRVKRIETRLTSLCVAMGVGTHAQRPEFEPASNTAGARVNAPSPHTSVKEIVDSIPETCHEPVGVFVGSDQIAEVRIARGR